MLDMQEHAGKANALLRDFRKKYDENLGRNDRIIEDRAKKQEIRFWKRMAMPEVGDGDESIWSDDDDLVDPAEKDRLREVERKVAEQALAGMGSSDSQQGEESEGDEAADELHGLVGGVAMERDGSNSSVLGHGMPPPPRPQSTGSTGGQAG